ncbi:DUF5818 domain-containing protein [Sphingomonas solaris]|uniref:Uncharacterized protein n=1 Tax=Alterirhizorhabdus solaris TaxID=2529389 RepID=A0A558QWV9_9SPHN|nr:hypothetical protein [Sphingomonas solaris]TVV71646.1 hypothetical protein FOY91_16345 [Sphingomonas solaris]
MLYQLIEPTYRPVSKSGVVRQRSLAGALHGQFYPQLSGPNSRCETTFLIRAALPESIRGLTVTSKLMLNPQMPEGTRHEFTGMLHAVSSALVLKLHDGREWLIIAPAGIDRFIDRQVKVSGVRGEGRVLHINNFCAVET